MSDTGIRLKIADYLAGNIDAFNLEELVSAMVWDAPPSDERQLGYDALRLLAEAANGEWTDAELRGHLKARLGILADGDDSVSVKPSPPGVEGLFDRLTEAEAQSDRVATGEDARLAALMTYAQFAPTAGSSGTAQPSSRGFLRQPRVESNTPSPSLKEVAAS